MPLPKGYLPREGDIVVLHAKVKYDVTPGEDRVLVKAIGSFGDISTPLDKVVSLHCRNWNEGDMVIDPGNLSHGSGKVLAVFDDVVWVKFRAAYPETIHANRLAPAPEEESKS
jgi:hypothetical protein